MIFSLQFSEETGYCDNIQQMTGARDTYDGWTEIKPSADFVDYYKNADGYGLQMVGSRRPGRLGLADSATA